MDCVGLMTEYGRLCDIYDAGLRAELVAVVSVTVQSAHARMGRLPRSTFALAQQMFSLEKEILMAEDATPECVPSFLRMALRNERAILAEGEELPPNMKLVERALGILDRQQDAQGIAPARPGTGADIVRGLVTRSRQKALS